MHRPVRRPATLLVAFLVVLAGQLSLPSTAQAADATDQLRTTGTSTYELQPGRHTIHVTTKYVLTNKAQSTSRSHSCTQYYVDPYVGRIPYTTTCTTRTTYYYDYYTVWIERDATNVKLTGDGGPTSLHLSGRDGLYRKVKLSFANLNYGRTRHLTLSYDLPAGGPRSTAARRAGSGYANFCAVGPGSDTGSVKVVIPAGFRMSPTRSMSATTSDDRTVFSTTAMKEPWTFVACLAGSNDAGYATTQAAGPGGRPVTVQAWKDDPEWAAAVTTVIETSLPGLETLLGALPTTQPLTVREHPTVNALDDYTASTGVMRLGETTVTIDAVRHRIALLWFDSTLFKDQWLRDGYADWAVRAADPTVAACPDPGRPAGTVGATLATAHEIHVTATSRERSLRAWERAAGCHVLSSISAAIGTDRMRDVLVSLRGNGSAFRPAAAGAPDRVGARTTEEWLDTVEMLGLRPAGAEPDTAAALAARFGASREPARLAARREALSAFESLRSLLGEPPPVAITDPLAAWSFDAATGAMTAARTALETVNRAEGLVPPVDSVEAPVRTAVRSALTQADLDAALALATRQLALATDVADALAVAAAPRDLVQEVGLIGTVLPTGADAIDAVARVDVDAGTAAASELRAVVGDARDAGTLRLAVVIAGVGLGVLILLLLAVRRRRQGRSDRLSVLPPQIDDTPAT